MEINQTQKNNKLFQKEVILSLTTSYNLVWSIPYPILILKLGLIVNALWTSSDPQVKFTTYRDSTHQDVCSTIALANTLSKTYSYNGAGNSMSASTIDLMAKFYEGYSHIWIAREDTNLNLYSNITKSELNIIKVYMEYRLI